MASLPNDSVGYRTRSLARALAILPAFGPERNDIERHGSARAVAYKLGPRTFELGVLFAPNGLRSERWVGTLSDILGPRMSFAFEELGKAAAEVGLGFERPPIGGAGTRGGQEDMIVDVAIQRAATEV